MDALKTVLTLCELITILCLLFYAIMIVTFFFRKLLRKTDEKWATLNPKTLFIEQSKRGNLKGVVIFSVIITSGLLSLVCGKVFATTEMGAFFEVDYEYTEQYEAYVYIKDKPIYCIATVEKIIDREAKSKDYYITRIELPYNKTEYDLWEEYNPKSEKNQVWLGADAERCKIIIRNVATDKSFEVLENTVVTAYGDYCASRAGKTFHWHWCPSAANISDKNKVFFESETEAIALRFSACQLCFGY